MLQKNRKPQTFFLIFLGLVLSIFYLIFSQNNIFVTLIIFTLYIITVRLFFYRNQFFLDPNIIITIVIIFAIIFRLILLIKGNLYTIESPYQLRTFLTDFFIKSFKKIYEFIYTDILSLNIKQTTTEFANNYENLPFFKEILYFVLEGIIITIAIIICKKFRITVNFIGIYLWNPFLVASSFSIQSIEIQLFIIFISLSILFIIIDVKILSAIFLGISAFINIFTILLIPLFIRKLKLITLLTITIIALHIVFIDSLKFLVEELLSKWYSKDIVDFFVKGEFTQKLLLSNSWKEILIIAFLISFLIAISVKKMDIFGKYKYFLVSLIIVFPTNNSPLINLLLFILIFSHNWGVLFYSLVFMLGAFKIINNLTIIYILLISCLLFINLIYLKDYIFRKVEL